MYEQAAKALLIAQIAVAVGAATFGLWITVMSADGLHTYLMTRSTIETIKTMPHKRASTAPL